MRAFPSLLFHFLILSASVFPAAHIIQPYSLPQSYLSVADNSVYASTWAISWVLCFSFSGKDTLKDRNYQMDGLEKKANDAGVVKRGKKV